MEERAGEWLEETYWVLQSPFLGPRGPSRRGGSAFPKVLELDGSASGTRTRRAFPFCSAA